MGQGGSKGCLVHVQLDRSYYYSGDTVTGSVVLHAPHNLDFTGINVKVTGVEKCRWQERKQSGKVTHVETYHGKHVIFKHKLPLHGPGTIPAGDYQWPISFVLPSNVPGSFDYHCDSTRAEVEYKVKADVLQEGLFKANLKKTLRFEVLQRCKVAGPTGPQAASLEKPISAWCCFNKGSIGVGVTTDSGDYPPGSSMQVNAQVVNKSTVDVNMVEFRLQQRMHLVAQTFWGDHHKRIDITRVISRQQAIGDSVCAAGGTSNYQAVLNLDRSFEATCLGKVVQSIYELDVTAKTGCCLSEVRLKQPIIINDPQPISTTQQYAMEPPPGWAPQVYPTVAFALPAPEYYGSSTAVLGVPAPVQPQPLQQQHQQQQGGYMPPEAAVPYGGSQAQWDTAGSQPQYYQTAQGAQPDWYQQQQQQQAAMMMHGAPQACHNVDRVACCAGLQQLQQQQQPVYIGGEGMPSNGVPGPDWGCPPGARVASPPPYDAAYQAGAVYGPPLVPHVTYSYAALVPPLAAYNGPGVQPQYAPQYQQAEVP